MYCKYISGEGEEGIGDGREWLELLQKEDSVCAKTVGVLTQQTTERKKAVDNGGGGRAGRDGKEGNSGKGIRKSAGHLAEEGEGLGANVQGGIVGDSGSTLMTIGDLAAKMITGQVRHPHALVLAAPLLRWNVACRSVACRAHFA